LKKDFKNNPVLNWEHIMKEKNQQILNKLTLHKGIIFLLLLVIFLIGCSAIVKDYKRQQYKTDIARNATYLQPYEEIYTAVYSVISASIYKIARESESRGYIETEWIESSSEKSSSRRRILAEIIGRAAPYRVTVNAERENKTLQENGEWSKITVTRDRGEEDRYLVQIYEALHGQIPLPPDLQ
jgi:uncharacterized lipoprotein